MSRIAPLVKKLIGTEDADDLMLEILEALTEPPVVLKQVNFIPLSINQRLLV